MELIRTKVLKVISASLLQPPCISWSPRNPMRIEHPERWEGLFSTQKCLLKFEKWVEVDKPNYSTFVTCLTAYTAVSPLAAKYLPCARASSKHVHCHCIICRLQGNVQPLSPSSSGAVQTLLIDAAVGRLLTSHGNALSTKWLSALLLSSGYFIIFTKSSNFSWRKKEAPRSEYP